MQIDDDIDTAVKIAREHRSRSAFTHENLRINLCLDRKKGWVMIVVSLTPAASATPDELRQLAAQIGNKIRATSNATGAFGPPEAHDVGAQRTWVMKWVSTASDDGAGEIVTRPDELVLDRLVGWARENPDPDKHGIQHEAFVANGWKLILTRHTDTALHTTECWHFSASLYPMGRGSTDEDWTMLGRLLAHVHQGHQGEPTLITDMHETHPNAVHHWVWHPDGSACPLAAALSATAAKIHEKQGFAKQRTEEPS